jgi:hypothetical protein
MQGIIKVYHQFVPGHIATSKYSVFFIPSHPYSISIVPGGLLVTTSSLVLVHLQSQGEPTYCRTRPYTRH